MSSADILIVEDSPTQAEELRYILEKNGYRTAAAHNGTEALDMLRKKKPTLIISDILMPVMDGFELCRRIKGNERLKEIPVILLTSLSDPEDVLRGLECGADNFIIKPYDDSYLITRIRHMLITTELRKESKVQIGVEIFFKEQKYFITSERKQILDLLLSTYETAVMKNFELKTAQNKLETLNEQLENKVEERTEALIAEIEERKKIEEKIKSLNEGLEQRVAARTMELKRHNAVLDGIGRIFKEALASETDEKLAQACLRVVEDITDSKFGFIAEIGADGLLHDTAISDPGWELCTMYDKTGHRRPPGDFKIHGLYGRVLQDGKSFFTNNPFSHPDSIGTPEGHPPLKAFLGAPLVQGGAVIGMIAVGNREGGYRTSDMESLEALAQAIVEALYRMRTERALRQSEARFRLLFDTMTEGFSLDEIILDDEGKPVDLRYVMVNAAFERHTGLKAKDVVGRTTRELFPEAEPVWFERYGKVVLTGEPAHFEERFGPLNKWFAVSVYRTEPSRFAVVFFDISERKQAEEALRLTSNELLTSNKELEAFSYSVSHDLRAPLRFISGFSKIINEGYADKLDAQGRDYLARIKNGSDRMSQLIDDLLRLSHLSRQKVELLEYDLSGLASVVMNSLRETDPARNIEGVIAEGLRAVIDPNLMKIAFTNLFNNAWKFTAMTENARIEFGAAVKDGETVYFVKDNGAGFNPIYAEKMFLPFQRLHSEKEFEGTGIGLAIVERIIRRHGGKVWAEGEIGKGASVYFTLG